MTNPSIVKSWGRVLRQGGYQVVTASDGGEGLAAARSERPALIITDQSMPTINGIELCSLIKLESELAQVPIILISADPPAADRDAKWDKFLFKPVSIDVLLDSVEYLLTPDDG
ncbi:response regulator [Paraburkholderia fungorum]|uniref:response regulator n=1 Tax=Paraburkholderia fungorum TaxID=134537 RepID=UPI0038BBEDF0